MHRTFRLCLSLSIYHIYEGGISHVLALEVPMNDHGLLLVQVVAPHGHVGRDVNGLRQRQLHLLLVQQVVERACA